MVNPVTSASQIEARNIQATGAQSAESATPAAKAQVSQQPGSALGHYQQPPTARTAQDTVSISSLAKNALREAIETRFQTAQEARSGDLQAQRLLAKEEAAAKATQR